MKLENTLSFDEFTLGYEKTIVVGNNKVKRKAWETSVPS